METVKKGCLAITAMLLLVGLSFGQSVTSQSSTAGENMSRTGGVLTSDRQFMDKAAQGGMAEVELGQLAQQNGQSQAVKDFGQRMVTDHSKANEQLKQLAAQKGVSLPATVDAKDKAIENKLSKLQGAAFDKAYMKDMVADHKQDVAEFKKASMTAKDPDLKSWAGQTLPTLESHLQEAEKVAPQVGVNTASAMDNAKSSMNSTAESH